MKTTILPQELIQDKNTAEVNITPASSMHLVPLTFMLHGHVSDNMAASWLAAITTYGNGVLEKR